MNSTPSTDTLNNDAPPIREVTLVNEGGGIIGHKPRSMLQKTDVPHSVFVLIITPERQVALSKLSHNRLSATAVTLCERDEDAIAAATRSLLPRAIPIHHLGDQLYRSEDDRAIYLSVFYGVSPLEPHASYELLDNAALTERLADFTPALGYAWQSYRRMLPM